MNQRTDFGMTTTAENNTIFFSFDYLYEKPLDIQKFLLKGSLTHEIQHAIQAQEGFAHGSSPEYFETHPVREEKLKNDYEKAIKEEYNRKKGGV